MKIYVQHTADGIEGTPFDKFGKLLKGFIGLISPSNIFPEHWLDKMGRVDDLGEAYLSLKQDILGKNIGNLLGVRNLKILFVGDVSVFEDTGVVGCESAEEQRLLRRITTEIGVFSLLQLMFIN